jgi:hypothetical protein
MSQHIMELVGKIVDEAKVAGIKIERQRILQLADSLICFEHHKGCEHAGCYAIGNLISYIKEGTK